MCVLVRGTNTPYYEQKYICRHKRLVWPPLYGGIVGPVFIEGNINGDNYLQILKQHVIPFMEKQFEEMLFEQDGAPAHYAKKVWNYLNEK